MNKLQMAHEYALEMAKQGISLKSCKELGWRYADAMQAEADKRNKAEAEQKRKEIREMLNATNTFIELQGQHFDDVEEWQPDWSQAPEWANWWAMDKDGEGFYFENKPMMGSATWLPVDPGNMKPSPTFNYQGDWKESLRERPNGF